MVTVLLPTAKRPSFLRKGLTSIAAQTALAQIERVVVSENGGDRASQEVCREFPQLPITYIFREPALSPMRHGQALYQEFTQSEYTAILHDDDFWLSQHIEMGLAALKANADAPLYGAAFFCDDGKRVFDGKSELYAWLGANYPPRNVVWKMTAVEVLLANVYNMVIHYSGMIARTAALRKAAAIFERGNPYDNDREMLHMFSRLGPILFNPKAGAVVRIVGERDTGRFGDEEKNQRMAETTRWMIETSRVSWHAIAGLFAQRLARCPDEGLKVFFIREAVARPWVLPEVARHLDREQDKDFFALYDKAVERFAGVKALPDR